MEVTLLKSQLGITFYEYFSVWSCTGRLGTFERRGPNTHLE